MITDFFLNIAQALLSNLNSVLPAVSLPSELSSNATTLFSAIGSLNWLFPIDHFFVVAGLILAFEVSLIGVRLLLWVVHLIRGN